jgi:5-oxoprolinase (ATP-hydrolysing)
VSFGGAGGQHACAVAEKLGIGRVLISPFAAVLSAYGIGLAERREVKQVAVEVVLPSPSGGGAGDEGTPLNNPRWLDLTLFPLPSPPPEGEGEMHRLLLRYQGSDTTLAIPLGGVAAMTAAFHAEHQARYGFADPKRALICAAIETETVSGGGEPLAFPPEATAPGLPLAARPIFLHGEWRPTPIFRRESLCAGQQLAGPALIVEAGSTTLLEPGWRAEMTPRGDLLLTLNELHIRRPDPSRPDPTWLTLFNRRFMSLAEDMGRALQMTARSVNIRERLDFSCALFDAAGDLIANAPHIPVHLGSMGDSVRAIRQRFATEMRPGDAFLINSPYAGGTHLPDITVVMPVFDETGAIPRYFTAARAHHADVGGISPGSMPADSRHIDQEGCRSDGMLIVRDGRMLETETRAWLGGCRQNPAPSRSQRGSPARNPDQNIADLQAQVAACHLGARLLRQLEAEVGAESVLAYMGFVQDNAEAAVRRLLGRLRDGAFRIELDPPPSPSGGGAGGEGNRVDQDSEVDQPEFPHPNPLPEGEGAKIHVALRIAADASHAVIDFAGTSPQQPGNLNAPASIAHSAVLYVFRTLIDSDIPLNAGVLRPLNIHLPHGCLLNPVYPAAVVAGNVETSQNIVDALYGALGALASSQGTMNNFSFGDATHQYYETVCGGTGAGPGFAGASGVHSHMTNSRLTDPEVMELNFPVLLERFALRHGSGGAGQYPGGDGVERRIRFLAPMRANLLALRRQVGGFGLNGGAAGAVGRQWITRADGTHEELAGIGKFDLAPGDVFVLETPGGGGYGAP